MPALLEMGKILIGKSDVRCVLPTFGRRGSAGSCLCSRLLTACMHVRGRTDELDSIYPFRLSIVSTCATDTTLTACTGDGQTNLIKFKIYPIRLSVISSYATPASQAATNSNSNSNSNSNTHNTHIMERELMHFTDRQFDNNSMIDLPV